MRKKNIISLLQIVIFLVLFKTNVFALANESIINIYNSDIIIIFLKIVVYIISFIIVLMLAYYFSKLVSIKTSGFIKERNIKMIEGINLGKNNKIILIKVMDYVYVLAISNNHTTVIDKIPYNEVLTESTTENIENKSLNPKIFGTLKNIFNVRNRKKSILDTDVLFINKRLNEIKSKISRINSSNIDDCQNYDSDEDEKNE